MFEVLVLVAVVVVLAQFNKRLSQLERDVADLHGYSAWSVPSVSAGEVPPQTEAGPWVVAERFETDPGEPAPLDQPIPYAELQADAGNLESEATELPHRELAGPDEVAHEPPPARSFNFEELFGRQLPIWAGGITLAVAGMLIVKLSIDAGLLSPLVRVILGSIFGFVLIGGAELALRQEVRVQDPRVRQALSGAGIASLYASILIAANLYQLIGPLTAMLGMAAITAMALGLSLRFGAPSALLGLAGGLAAPALIGSAEPNIPLLSLYLALAVGGLCTVSRGQRWAWLGVSALVGGFGWGLILIVGGTLDAPSTISVALLLLLVGVGLPMLGFAGSWQSKMQLVAAVAAAAQMAALVAMGGFSLLNWGLFGLISLAMISLSNREVMLERLPPVGLLITLMLLGLWPDPGQRNFTLVMVGSGLIYGVPALRRLWREKGGIIEAAEIAAIAVGGYLLTMFHFYQADGYAVDMKYGLLAIALSSLAAGAAALGWKHAERRDDARFAILAIGSAFLAAFASSLILPPWLSGVGMAAIGLTLLVLGRIAGDWRLEPASWLFAGAGLIDAGIFQTFALEPVWKSMASWTALAALFGAYAWLARIRYLRMAAQFLAPVLLQYGLSWVVPGRWEPLIAPLILVVLAAMPVRLVPAMAGALLVVIGWAIEPVFFWLVNASGSILADPMFVTGVPPIEDTQIKLMGPALLIGASLWLARGRLKDKEWRIATVIGTTTAVIAMHSLYKHLYAIGSPEAFVAYGLVERTLWGALLLASAAALWRLGQARIATAFLAAAFAHSAFYTLILHNPLWSSQAVGALPVFNLLPLAYAIPVAVVLAADRVPQLREIVPQRAITLTWMMLVMLFAASMLRQLFHGSLLVEPGLSEAEDIARSILAIALAIGFLLWGIRTEQRDWRIGSLVLMLGAVAKVFLWDTSGLEGVVRIASFVALGFSLIGLGWLYSRQLAPSRA